MLVKYYIGITLENSQDRIARFEVQRLLERNSHFMDECLMAFRDIVGGGEEMGSNKR